MPKNNLYAVILAGGSGERFWPLSTRARPKQFLSLIGGKPLLTLAVERLDGLLDPDHVFVVTADRLVAATREAAPAIPPENIVGEPCKRDTAAAVAVACALVRRRDPQGVVCILTADQLMEDAAGFRRVLEDAAQAAVAQEAIAVIGIKPTFPATGFGYLETGAALELGTATPISACRRFVEKPDAARAAAYLAQGNYLWNAGMFIFSVDVMARELARLTPPLAELARALVAAPDAAAFRREMERRYEPLAKISIDYAVMEKAEKVIVAHGDFGWDDVGSWTSAAAHLPADAKGNAVVGEVAALDSRENIVVSPHRLTALIGCEGLVVVQTERATLVCPKQEAQRIKALLAEIAQRPDAEQLL